MLEELFAFVTPPAGPKSPPSPLPPWATALTPLPTPLGNADTPLPNRLNPDPLALVSQVRVNPLQCYVNSALGAKQRSLLGMDSAAAASGGLAPPESKRLPSKRYTLPRPSMTHSRVVESGAIKPLPGVHVAVADKSTSFQRAHAASLHVTHSTPDDLCLADTFLLHQCFCFQK